MNDRLNAWLPNLPRKYRNILQQKHYIIFENIYIITTQKAIR